MDPMAKAHMPVVKAHMAMSETRMVNAVRYTSNPLARRPPSKISTGRNKSRRLKELRANAALNLRKNSDLPVARLPVELLVEIFYQYIFHGADQLGDTIHLLNTESCSPNFFGKRDCRWLIVTQICHSWRNIVLSAPVLWSYLTADLCNYPRILEMALSRSAKALLNVELHRGGLMFPGMTVETWARLFEESHRIKRLDLDLSASSLATITPNSVAPFACLEHLKISTPQDFFYYPPYPVPMINRILEEDRPPLKIAIFNNIDIPSHLFSNLPSTLTHLSLNVPNDRLCSGITSFHFLRKLDKLEILHLEPIVYPAKRGDRIVALETGEFTLPHLKELSIAGDHSCMLALLDRMKLPSITRIRTRTLSDEEHQVGPLCANVLSRIHPTIDYQQAHGIIDFSFMVGFAICAHEEHRPRPFPPQSYRIPLGYDTGHDSSIKCDRCYISLSFFNYFDDMIFGQITNVPSMKVALSNLKTIYLRLPPIPHLEDKLAVLFSLTENLEVLKIKEWSCGEDFKFNHFPACRAMAKVLHAAPDCNTVLLPKLKTLEVSGVFDPDHSMEESLRASVETRQASGDGLASLPVLSVLVLP
ncbi:hypothetical protein QCA50_017481 [Cerrena zonata]|uniref:F-box domain-containing protein n=1 Tax=Cerrena zonata TaxID=2478898 RepID=A0AAW0FJB4_9APHY